MMPFKVQCPLPNYWIGDVWAGGSIQGKKNKNNEHL